jgi:nanoRNase/pAp phosphatase (c-di-AMP/oligoRNAs hydrolase)
LSFLHAEAPFQSTPATPAADELVPTGASTEVKPSSKSGKSQSAKFLGDNGLDMMTDSKGMVKTRPVQQVTDGDLVDSESGDGDEEKQVRTRRPLQEDPAKIVPTSGFNVVLTHCTADFDSLASAVGLAKLWSSQNGREDSDKSDFDSSSHLPTFVVLPRGAHPSVQRFLALHKHLFPIRSLKSLPDDLSGLNRLGLVDAQRRDRIGPAEPLLEHATRITVVDHHLDADSDIPASDYVLDKVGSVSTLIVERLIEAQLPDGLTEAEATLLALGIHADTGSLCFDSTTPRDAKALAWVMEQGASQAAIAEHAKESLSPEQQGVLTQALINTNSTQVHGVTISTVLLAADGFINGLAAVTQDALELSSSDVYLLGLVYEAKPGGQRKGKGRPGERITTHLLQDGNSQFASQRQQRMLQESENSILQTEAIKGDELMVERLRASFDRKDLDGSGYLDKKELTTALASSGIIASEKSVEELMDAMDTDKNGKIDYNEFVKFGIKQSALRSSGSEKKPCTLIIIGRVKAGVNMKSIKLGKMLEERFGGGGHPKAASATVRLEDEADAPGIMNSLVEELVESSLQEQATVGEFMTAPVLSVRSDMTEQQVENLFTQYDVRALPVVDENNDVIGLVTYKEVAAAKQRTWNKEQKQLRQEAKVREQGKPEESTMMSDDAKKKVEQRKGGSIVKAWMKQHVKTVEASRTMAEVEAILLANDVGCIPVVMDGTMQLVGMVTRTDLLRQHRYYPSLHYHNKGMSDSIAARKPIIELRRKLKQFDLDE